MSRILLQIPGFRSKVLWRILLAVVLYEWVAVDVVRGAARGDVDIVATGTLLLAIFLLASNVSEVRSHLPLLRRRGLAFVLGWVAVGIIALVILALLPEAGSPNTGWAEVAGWRLGSSVGGAIGVFVNNWPITVPLYVILSAASVVGVKGMRDGKVRSSTAEPPTS
jgi:hypothetical protein